MAADNVQVELWPLEARVVPLWRNRDYVLLLSGQTVSAVGSQVSTVAFPLMVLALTGNAALAGIVGALKILPFLLLGLLAGALVDRWDRKAIMILSDGGRAIAMGSIPLAAWLGHLSVIQVCVVALVEGTFFAFFSLSQAASLPRIVAPGQLGRAAAQTELSMSSAGLVGPPLAGALFQAVGRAAPFLLDALSYAASVVSLLMIRTDFQEERSAPSEDIRRSIEEGIRWVWNRPVIRVLAFFSGGINMIFAGELLIIIVLARDLRASPWLIGLIISISAVGGIAGTLMSDRVAGRLPFGSVIRGWWGIASLLWPLMALAPHPLFLAVIGAALAFIAPIYWVTQFTYRASLVPDELQGRVNSAFRILAFGGAPVGTVLTGLSLQTFGGRATVLIIWGALLLLGAMALAQPAIRRAGRA